MHATLLGCVLLGTFVSVSGQAQLIFTEYVEGKAENKAVEIGNVGDETYSFATEPVTVGIYRGGNTLDTTVVIDSGVLAPGSVLVIANERGQQLTSAPNVEQATVLLFNGLNFNGDDAVGLINGTDASTGEVIDLIGTRPDMTNFLELVTIRKNTTESAEPQPQGFPSLDASEWVAFEADDFAGLGCIGLAACLVSPTPSPVTVPPAAGGRLIFTEYVEGKAQNKAVEIANVGDAAYDFSASPITVGIYRSGNTLDRQIAISTGLLLPGAVLIVANAQARDILDSSNVQSVRTILNINLDFNGNDAVGLINSESVLTDLIGSRPNMPNFLKDLTLRKDTDITEDPQPAGFDEIQGSNWVAFEVGTFSGLGCIGINACASPSTPVPVVPSPPTPGASASLIFTEYVEGSGVNKAVEIANVGAADYDFSSSPVTVGIYRSGNSLDSRIEVNAGVLSPGRVLVVANKGAGSLLSSSNLALAQRVVESGNVNFNGDDAVAIIIDDVVVDLIGSRPNMAKFLADKTIRKNTAESEAPQPNGFTSVNSQDSAWVSFPRNDFAGLGCIGVAACNL